MLRWFQALMPHEDKFFALYNNHAAVLVKGAGALCELLKGGAGVNAAAQKIFAYEAEADAISQNILAETRRTFITPFDRGDIKDLINSLDDTIDQMQKTAKAVQMFEVQTLEPEMAQMGARILQAAQLTVEAVKLLGSLRVNAAKLHSITEEIIHLEENTDALNDSGIKALFKRYRDGNAMDYLVGTEIYNHLERVMDRFEDVAHRIGDILIEQV